MKREEMQRRKKELGYSNEKLAELSGVPPVRSRRYIDIWTKRLPMSRCRCGTPLSCIRQKREHIP